MMTNIKVIFTSPFFTDNYYKDTCLVQAGGEPLGTLDFDQIHTYSWEGRWNTASPFRVLLIYFSLTVNFSKFNYFQQ